MAVCCVFFFPFHILMFPWYVLLSLALSCRNSVYVQDFLSDDTGWWKAVYGGGLEDNFESEARPADEGSSLSSGSGSDTDGSKVGTADGGAGVIVDEGDDASQDVGTEAPGEGDGGHRPGDVSVMSALGNAASPLVVHADSVFVVVGELVRHLGLVRGQGRLF